MQEDENGSSDDGDKVQWKIRDISHQGSWAEAFKGALEYLAEPLHGLVARLDLAALADYVCGVSGDEGAVKGVKDGILEDPVAGDDVDNGGALIEDQEDGGDNGEGSVDKDKDG